jgi:hypothetical protein
MPRSSPILSMQGRLLKEDDEEEPALDTEELLDRDDEEEIDEDCDAEDDEPASWAKTGAVAASMDRPTIRLAVRFIVK